MSDDDLLSLQQTEGAGETSDQTDPQPTAQWGYEHWNVVDGEGNEVADISSMSALELLELQVRYNADGQEHKVSFNDAIRAAQRQGVAERQRVQTEQQRNQVAQELDTLQQKLGELTT